MYTVSLEKFIQKMKVKNLTPDVDISAIEITQSDVNRPALQLAGFFDYFDHHRIQIAAHSGLQKDQITIFFLKIQKRCCSLNLKRGRMIWMNFRILWMNWMMQQ